MTRGVIAITVPILGVCLVSVGLAGSSPQPAATLPAVASLTVAADATVADIELVGSSNFSITSDDGAKLHVSGDSVAVPLQFRSDAAGVTRLTVKAGGQRGTITIEYYPAAVFAKAGIPTPAAATGTSTSGTSARGTSSPGTILLYTDLARLGSPRLDPSYITAVPPSRDTYLIDEKRWVDARYVGDIPSAFQASDSALLQLYRRLDALNHPSLGRLCSDLLPGIDTYYAMANQSCYVWCSGYSRITRDLLRSMGTPARIIGLTADDATLPNDILVQSSEGHQTVELWDGDHWAWVDPSFRLLRVTIGASPSSGTSLSVYDTIRALADRVRRATLWFTVEDASSHQWVIRRWGDLDQVLRSNLLRYLSADKTLSVAEGGTG